MFTTVNDPRPAADDTPDGAQVLSFGPDGSVLIEDTVGGADPRDFFRFTLDQPGPVQLTLEGAGGNVDLYIYDEHGTLLGASTNGSGEIDFLEGNAPAGTYYVRVEPADGTPTSYRLGVQTAVSGPTEVLIQPEVDPGHTLATAMALPLQPGVPLVVQDQVGGGQDPADLYRFDLAEGQPVRIALQGDQGDVDLFLLDDQGNVIARSINGGLEIDNLEGELAAGTYHVAVVPYGDAATTYSLSIQTGATAGADVIRPEVDPGHTLATAMALPLQPGTPTVVQDQVGGGDDPADLYRFDLAEGQAVRIALQGDQGDVDLFLLDDQGNVIARSVNGGLEIDSLEGELAAGTYHVAVVPHGDAATTYSLAIETGSILDVPSGAAAASALPESLALRDATGLGVGGAASAPFGQSQSEALATQLLAVA